MIVVLVINNIVLKFNFNRNTIMKTFKLLKYLFISAFILINIYSCQEEVTEISEPNDKEIFKSDSELSNLMFRTAKNDGSKDNIIDRANCLEVKLPVTVVVNDIEVIIDSEKDFDTIEKIYDEFSGDIDKLDIKYPIVIISEDFEETKINNQDELNELITSCTGENVDDEDIECIDFQYPISISIFNTSFDVVDTKKVNNDRELFIFVKNLDINTLASLNFPVTMVLADESEVVVNNNQELIRTIKEAKDSCDEDDDYDYDDDDLNCDVASIKRNLKDCNWTIDSYVNKTELEGTTILFKDDFTFKALSNIGVEIGNGNWTVEKVGEYSYVKFDSDFQYLKDDWKVVECGDNFIEAFRNGDDFMRIEKNCSDLNLDAVKETITNCKWYMSYLKSQGNDLTAEYSDYHFDFKENGTFVMTTGVEEGKHEGTWTLSEIASGGVAISLSSSTLNEDINDYYLIRKFDDNKIYFQGEQNHVLELERVCSDAEVNIVERVKNLIADCTWSTDYFELDGKDVTSQFMIYYVFKDDGTFLAEGNGKNYEGTWGVDKLSNGTIGVYITSSNLPEELTDEYVLTYNDDKKIHLMDALENRLKLEKKCI